jgi:hypothetical protein
MKGEISLNVDEKIKTPIIDKLEVKSDLKIPVLDLDKKKVDIRPSISKEKTGIE